MIEEICRRLSRKPGESIEKYVGHCMKAQSTADGAEGPDKCSPIRVHPRYPRFSFPQMFFAPEKL